MTAEQDAKQGTGRTTRMMEYILSWVEAYPRIRAHVCMPTDALNRYWEREVRSRGFEAYQIQFVLPSDARIDWSVPTLRDPSCRGGDGDYYGFFADHAVIELRFNRHLQHMTQYDQGSESNRAVRSMRERDTERALARGQRRDAALFNESVNVNLRRPERPDSRTRADFSNMELRTIASMLGQSEVQTNPAAMQALEELREPAPAYSERGIAGMNAPPEPPPPLTLRQRLRGKK